jgi:hypothetical protein
MKNIETDFDIILAKNRIARELKFFYAQMNMTAREAIKQDFDKLEEKIGTMNQPTAREIFESTQDI